MANFVRLISLVLAGIIFDATANGAKTEKSYDSGNYLLKFEAVGNKITFEVTVKTAGWVGIGVSQTSTMQNSDLFMGGVLENGQPYSKDYYADSNTQPIEDSKEVSDWNLEAYSSTATTTSLTVSRLLKTPDPSPEDIEIKNEPVYFLWAYAAEDLPGGGYHGRTTRGSERINLVNPAKGNGASAIANIFSLLVLQIIFVKLFS